jgi:hypothetical protein
MVAPAVVPLIGSIIQSSILKGLFWGFDVEPLMLLALELLLLDALCGGGLAISGRNFLLSNACTMKHRKNVLCKHTICPKLYLKMNLSKLKIAQLVPLGVSICLSWFLVNKW